MVSSPSFTQPKPTIAALLRFDHPADQDAIAQAESCRAQRQSPAALLRACIERIEQADLFVHAIAERRYSVALEEAKRQVAPSAPPALWGVPFPVAETWLPKEFSFATASIQEILALFPTNHPIRTLCEAGAVPLVSTRTTVHSTSYRWPWAVERDVAHPYHPNRLAGAGYSGDAALIGAGALTFAVGEEASAEVRHPAHQCGILGHNLGVPSPNTSQAGTSPDRQTSLLARSVRDLTTLSSLLTHKEPKVKNVGSNPWKDVTIWRCEDFGVPGWPTSAAHRQKLRQVGRVLAEHGARVQVWNTRRLRSALALSTLLLSDNPTDLQQNPGTAPDHRLWYSLLSCSQRRLGSLVSPLASPHTNRGRDIRLLQKELNVRLRGASVLLAPTFPDTAHLQSNGNIRPNPWLFAGLFRLLGWDCTTLPVGVQSNGLPLGVQFVSSPQQASLRLQAADLLEQALGGWLPPCLVDL